MFGWGKYNSTYQRNNSLNKRIFDFNTAMYNCCKNIASLRTGAIVYLDVNYFMKHEDISKFSTRFTRVGRNKICKYISELILYQITLWDFEATPTCNSNLIQINCTPPENPMHQK